MRRRSIRPEFVNFIPGALEDDVLYISIPYATATHKCACGCGKIVVTPIRPTDWSLTWNGERVTLNPSIGNWSLPCQSHYWIVENKIVWVRRWEVSEIGAARAKDRRAKAQYYRRLQKPLTRTVKSDHP